MKKKKNDYTFLVMPIVAVLLGYLLSGGPWSHAYQPSSFASPATLVNNSQKPGKTHTMQFNSLVFITPTYTPTPTP